MIVRLKSLKFDVVPGGAGALLLRKDAATPADPEAVAFALIPTANQRLTISVVFTVSDPEGPGTSPTAWIRARALDPARAVLGHVREQQVAFPPGGGDIPVQMTLDQPAFHQKGVGRYDVLWTWEVRFEGDGDWIVFQQTRHVAFITLDVPGSPWTQDLNPLAGRSWPWTRALDAACIWASAVKQQGTNSNTARKKVTKRVEAAVHALGNVGLVRYHSMSTLVIGPGDGTYEASKFLDVVEGAADNLPLLMNCEDCAITVAVFANLLGADAHLLSVDRPGSLHLNAFKRIGDSEIFSSLFGFHDIAVRGSESSAQVFDATLQPNWDVAAGQDFKLTQGRRRGPQADTGGTYYLQRLLERGQGQWDDLSLDPRPMPGL